MPLTPGYGETPFPHDELTALLSEVVDMLDKPITRAAVYDLERPHADVWSGVELGRTVAALSLDPWIDVVEVFRD